MNKYYCPYGGTENMLASGRALAQGEYFDLTADEEKDSHNKRLIEEGHIQKVPKTTKSGD